MRTRTNTITHELIGLPVKVERSTDPSIEGIQGLVMFETMNTFLVKKETGENITIQKARNTFRFDLAESDVMINGDDIKYRPQDRLKKLFHKRKQIVNRVR